MRFTEIKKQYQFSFLRLVPLAAALLVLVLNYYRRENFFENCVGDGYLSEQCSTDFLVYFYRPLGQGIEEILALLFFLSLLPNFLLRGWFLFVSWWALPLAAYNILTAPNSTGGFFESSTAAATVQSVNALLAVTIGYVILHLLLRALVRIFRKKQH